MLGAFFGFASGFFGSMPVTGPIALIVFRASLMGKFSSAMQIVYGAAIAETIYCALATFSYARIIAAMPQLASYMRYVGAAFLIALGLLFYLQKPPTVQDANTETAIGANRDRPFLAGFTVALLNPTLFLTWGSATSTIFSWFKTVSLADLIAFPVAAGVGIVCWFGLLVEIFKKFRERIGERVGFYAIRSAAVLLMVSGTYLLAQAILAV